MYKYETCAKSSGFIFCTFHSYTPFKYKYSNPTIKQQQIFLYLYKSIPESIEVRLLHDQSYTHWTCTKCETCVKMHRYYILYISHNYKPLKYNNSNFLYLYKYSQLSQNPLRSDFHHLGISLVPAHLTSLPDQVYTSLKCTKNETCAKLHMFYILYISQRYKPLTHKMPPIICSRRQFKILPLFQK